MTFTKEEWRVAFNAIFHASAAYHEEGVIQGMLNFKDGCGEPVFFNDEKTSTQAYAVRSGGVLWVGVRGSKGKLDWLRNFKFLRWGGMHRGFKGNAESILDPLEAVCKRHREEPVVITGHSMGGAVASILGFLLALKGYDVRVYTFGSPRAFSWFKSKAYNKVVPRTWRWVNDRDAVPRSPLRGMGFRHVGKLRFVDHRGVITNKVSDAVKARARGTWKAVTFSGIEGASDHDVCRYYAILRNNLPVDCTYGYDPIDENPDKC